jgi:hypothetical protein
MKKFFIYIALGILVTSCDPLEKGKGDLMMAGIGGTKGSEIVCMNLDSGEVVNSTPIDCYELGSTVYDPGTGGYGYCNCDTIFKLVNPVTGELIKSFKLPGLVSQIVIDSEDNMLIGRYCIMTYGADPDSSDTKSAKVGAPIYTNYVIRVSLATGAIVSKNKIDIGDGIYVSVYYYDQRNKKYFLYRSDQKLIAINPSTGVVTDEVSVGRTLFNSAWDHDNNVLVSMTYSNDDGKNYVEVVDPESGSVLSSKVIASSDTYFSNIGGYDPETSCYITVTGNNDVVFYDISTGELKKSVKLDVPLTDLRFWRK